MSLIQHSWIIFVNNLCLSSVNWGCVFNYIKYSAQQLYDTICCVVYSCFSVMGAPLTGSNLMEAVKQKYNKQCKEIYKCTPAADRFQNPLNFVSICVCVCVLVFILSAIFLSCLCLPTKDMSRWLLVVSQCKALLLFKYQRDVEYQMGALKCLYLTINL